MRGKVRTGVVVVAALVFPVPCATSPPTSGKSRAQQTPNLMVAPNTSAAFALLQAIAIVLGTGTYVCMFAVGVQALAAEDQ